MNRLASSGLLAFAAVLPAQAQPLNWINPGDFDYASHLGRTPSDPPEVPDGMPPGFDGSIAHPAALKVMVSGMDFLSDGRMALLHANVTGTGGMLYLLEGVSGPREDIKYTVIARDLWAPYGIKVLNDEIHFSAQDGIWKMVRKSGTPESWERRPVAKFIIAGMEAGAMNGSRYPIFNLAYHGGAFYYANGAYKNFNPRDKNLGYAVKLDLATGVQEILGRGIRMPNGMAANAAGDIFFSDNQGEYRPSSPIYHVVKGRHYGMAATNGVSGNEGGTMTNMFPLPPADSIFPAAVHVPYRPGSRSVTNLFLLDHTPFAGQFLAGDNNLGVVHRIQVEKVKGEYQGAAFEFSGVLEAGIQSFAKGPDGAIYGGALGEPGSGGHSWLNRTEGLMKWKLNGKPLQAMASVSSHREGFDIRFTEALDAKAANPGLYWVTSYYYQPTASYGGPRVDIRRHRITRIQSTEDRKTLSLSVEGLEPRRVYRLILSPELRTADALGLWTRNAWYTLNQISAAEPLQTGVSSSRRAPVPQAQARLIEGRAGLQMHIPDAGGYSIRLTDTRGHNLGTLRGTGPATRSLPLPGKGVAIVQLTTPNGTWTRIVGGSRH